MASVVIGILCKGSELAVDGETVDTSCQCGVEECFLAVYLPPQAVPSGLGWTQVWTNRHSEKPHLSDWQPRHKNFRSPLVHISETQIVLFFPFPLSFGLDVAGN